MDSKPDSSSTSPPPLSVDAPPFLSGDAGNRTSSTPPPLEAPVSGSRQLLCFLLNVCLGVFLINAIISLADDTLAFFLHNQSITIFRGLLLIALLLVSVPVYLLMGLTKSIPKSVFLPVTLFSPIAGLIFIPVMTYAYGFTELFSLLISLIQVILGVAILRGLVGRNKIRWPIFTQNQFRAGGFAWQNLALFVAANLFILLPVLGLYLFTCASLAVNHFSDGFVSLHPSGMMLQVREYKRDDGKVIELYPMAHVAEAGFYQQVLNSFPSNAIVLMEGVSDENNLLTNRITYKRMAKTLGLAEQQKEFKPAGPIPVRADVDVQEFSTNTINFLNIVMRMYSMGVSLETVLPVLRYSPSPEFQREIFDDILRKRNQHLLGVIRSQLKHSDTVVVPWGAAHMPEIAREIQKENFRLSRSWNYQAIRFGKYETQTPIK